MPPDAPSVDPSDTPPTLPAVELVLIRHALPIRLEVDNGPADPPLSSVGVSQAEAVAAEFPVGSLDALYTSPLLRARQTATPIEASVGLDAMVADGIAEWDRDANAYVPIEQLREESPEAWAALASGELHRLGIDVESFLGRVNGTLDAIAVAHRGQRVGVVCHGGVINVYLAGVLGLDRLLFFQPGYTSISRVAITREGRRGIISINETQHLR
jgi:2,3-bisphosphoglycerate-dependent phosphoglycerate mutase